MEILICKADPISERDDDAIGDMIIKITDKIPSSRSIENMDVFFDAQAKSLELALFESLPQGTRDRLLIYLMQRKVSLFRVRQ